MTTKKALDIGNQCIFLCPQTCPGCIYKSTKRHSNGSCTLLKVAAFPLVLWKHDERNQPYPDC